MSYVYKPQPGLPAMSETGTGLIVTELVANVERTLLRKVAGPGTTIEPVDGRWRARLPPGRHVARVRVRRLARALSCSRAERAAGPTLLLERDGLLLRVEGAISGDRAIEIARSIAARR